MPLAAPHAAEARRPIAWQPLAVVAAVFWLSGASCPTVVDQYKLTTAPVLPPAATLDEVVQVVNSNSARIQTLYATDATISSPMVPSLSATIAVERPRRFRLRAGTRVLGPEVDLGSNDEVFWMWVRRNQPPAIYVCRHEAFDHSVARRVLPVEPEWLIEALGIVQFDPADQHFPPTYLPDGQLDVRTIHQTPHGPQTKITRVDPSTGWVTAQFVYDQDGQLLASAVASEHQRDPVTNVVLPRNVQIEWPPAGFQLGVHLRDVTINNLTQNPEQFRMPAPDAGVQLVDLANPGVELPLRSRVPAPVLDEPHRPEATVVQRPAFNLINRFLRR